MVHRNHLDIRADITSTQKAVDILIDCIKDRSLKPDRTWRVSIASSLKRLEKLEAELEAAQRDM